MCHLAHTGYNNWRGWTTVLHPPLGQTPPPVDTHWVPGSTLHLLGHRWLSGWDIHPIVSHPPPVALQKETGTPVALQKETGTPVAPQKETGTPVAPQKDTGTSLHSPVAVDH